MNKDTLIVLIDAHLKHVRDIFWGRTIRQLDADQKLFAIDHEVAVMLDLIRNATGE